MRRFAQFERQHDGWLIGLLLVIFLSLPALAENYGFRIMGEQQDAVADLSACLAQMTGQPFPVEPVDAAQPGIMVLLADHDAVPEPIRAQLADADRETYVLHARDAERLWIVAVHANGLSHGIYDYLERLGCRWYFPNPHWELIPERQDITLPLDVRVAPAFISRDFFGTGGFGPRNPVDTKLEMRDRWATWKQRNRFGSQLVGYGHVGHGFSLRYADELKAHPEYRALVDGERVDYRAGIKFCVTEPGIVELFVEDRLREMRERVAKDPESLSSHFVGADPSDSGGFCQCEDCRAIGNGSVSDQVFHLANVVARAVANEFPGRGVSMYSYAHYADLPSIDLEPNLHVTVIPYAFQQTGMTGDELLKAWGERVAEEGMNRLAPLSMYTYWSITDWGRNEPSFDFRDRPPERIRFWYEQGVRSIKFESTYSAGAIGLGMQSAVRLMWNPSWNPDPWLDEFYTRSFGPAAPPMQRMLERWADTFLLTRQELAQSFRDLQAADKLADSEAVRARIGDYAIYVQYLRLWHTMQSAPADDREAAARDLTRFLWRTYHAAMVQPYRLWQLLGYREVKAIRDYFDPTKPEADEWQGLTSPDAAELRQWIADGIADYPLLGFEPISYEGELVPLQPAIQPGEGFGKPYSSIHSTVFHLQIPPGQDRFAVKLGVRHWHPGQEVKLTAYSPDNEQVLSHTMVVPGRDEPPAPEVIEIPASTPGVYRLEVFDQKNGFSLQGPAGIPLVLSPFIPHGWMHVYFYVPKGLRKLALYNPRRNVPAELFDPDGEKTELHQEDTLVIIPIPEGQDGRVWSLRRPGSSAPVRLLNAPSYFSLSPDTMMIPSELANQQR